MKEKYVHYIKALALALSIPCLYGCGSGGGGSSASLGSFVFGGGDTTVSLPRGGDDTGSLPLMHDSLSSTGTTTSTQLATIHNPEPATMLLFGSGIVAMRLTRNRKNSPPRGPKK